MADNKGLVEYARKALQEQWGYVWGTFGKVLTPDLLASKLRQYPDAINPYFDFIKTHWMDRRVTDCVGLIKGYYWGGGYVPTTDFSADGMLEIAKEKGSISTMPDIPGICVHKTGHIGVYVGNGEVIEAHGTKYGVIKTPLKGGTPWTSWLKCPYIDYVGVTAPAPQVSSNANIKDLQQILNSMGYRDENGHVLDVDGVVGPHTRAALGKTLIKRGDKNELVRWIQKKLGITADSEYGVAPYHETYDAVRNFQSKNGLEVDGIVGPKTWSKLV